MASTMHARLTCISAYSAAEAVSNRLPVMVTGGKVADMTNTPDSETYSEEETVARREAALKRMLATPPKLHKDSKLGRRRESQSK